MNKITKWGKKVGPPRGILSVPVYPTSYSSTAGFWGLRVSHLRLCLQLLLFPAWECACCSQSTSSRKASLNSLWPSPKHYYLHCSSHSCLRLYLFTFSLYIFLSHIYIKKNFWDNHRFWYSCKKQYRNQRDPCALHPVTQPVVQYHKEEVDIDAIIDLIQISPVLHALTCVCN